MTDAIQSTVTSALISVVLALVSAVLAFGVQYVKQHVSDKKIAAGADIARIVVHAAEQIGATLGFNGKAKFAEAIARARGIAASAGVSFSNEQWKTFIERAVAEMNNAYGSLLTPIAPPVFQSGEIEPGVEHPTMIEAPAGTLVADAPNGYITAPVPEPVTPTPDPPPTTALFYTSGPNAGHPVV